ncbi:MAG: PH domain-containing protein, partial [Patescibacteria group bacterium]
MIRRLLNIFNYSEGHFQGQEVGENVVLLLRRHKFTVLFPLSFLGLLAVLPLAIWVFLPPSIDFDLNTLSPLFWFILSLFYLFLWVLLFYFLTLYSLNTVIVTNHRIIENEQRAFFSRKVSELHVYRVQDVSAHTHGLIETFVGYGDIYVQTAGSEREFTFKKIGNPEEVKDRIMQVVSASQDGATIK